MSLFREELLDQAQAPAAVRGAHAVLVVDDEVGNLRVLRSLLGSRYQVHEAGDGAEALEVLDRLPPAQQPAVILSDQRMPGMTGVELLRRVRQLYPETIRLVLSGYSELRSVADAINEGGIYKFLAKPWDDEQLRAQLREAFVLKEMADRHRRLDEEVQAANRELAELNRQVQALREAQCQQNRREAGRRGLALHPCPQALLDHPGHAASSI